MSGVLWSPGYVYVGTLKGMGPMYQQSFIDTYRKVVFAKLYDRKVARRR